MSIVVGRFAPSPTGPLHLGSLLAATGSWLSARQQGGTWLVRMEDLDRQRNVPGADVEILEALRRYGLEWDGEVLYQSQREEHYREALERLAKSGDVFPCACSRADLLRSASAPAESDAVDAERVYPGTCRNGLADGRPARAIRFHAPDAVIEFDDRVAGHLAENVAKKTGDYVVRRADGAFAYQLAVVVDDALQGVTEVVRGGDLLSSTARQIALQRALGYPTPAYAHLPLIVATDGQKLGKRNGALPLATLDERAITDSLHRVLAMLAIEVDPAPPPAMLEAALPQFDPARIRTSPITL